MLILLLLHSALLVAGHGDHSFDLNDLKDISMPYAERHVEKPSL